ncbi:MAG: YcgN family cysteine cluster protein [Sphingomonadaceae bacterium]|uniref:YcgN family cysteine cluster protein n=1 Tax=Thermaurantiacus sp. TaxID=2820283 RepID=UPI00298F09A5|nr:YcgN family cysteine cluster protein [Thermaurantiacus sp.]MCS6987373.1 YcgN family cysteine cluster protein [Sphingomonadaceae bacterium]MDW8415291.1 YcgN family cysteine cluster protein [Thermaurantiacus sp.]
MRPRFWERFALAELSAEEWEALCDGCGRCCLFTLEDEETGRLYRTNVACRLLDPATCRCRDYARRTTHVPDCVVLTPTNVATLGWLPPTCAYRRLAEGRSLPAWHPLVSGDARSVHRAGASVRGRTIPEDDAGPLEDHVVEDDALGGEADG